MSISAISGSVPTQPAQLQASGRRDNDGDEATESAASKAREAASSNSQPVNANRGRNLNITA
jgi:hypothetical protein